jgi:hypothetical protein
MEVGEFLAAPINSDVRGSVVRRVHSTENLAIWEAIVNGTTQMNHEGIAVSIRVARKGYVGSLRYRYLPDEDD